MDETQTTPKQPNKMNPLIMILVVAVVAIGGIMIFNRMKNASMTKEDQTATIPQATDVPASDMKDGTDKTAQEITIEAGAYYFKPAEIRIKKGSNVRITVKGVDMMHNFTIDELGIATPNVKAGESTTIEFTATKAGTFQYYCSMPGHRAKGQVGTLIVE